MFALFCSLGTLRVLSSTFEHCMEFARYKLFAIVVRLVKLNDFPYHIPATKMPLHFMLPIYQLGDYELSFELNG